MSKSLSPAGNFLKWVIVPLSLAGIGYYVIGPRIGAGTPKPPESQDAAPTTDSNGPDSSAPDSSAPAATTDDSKSTQTPHEVKSTESKNSDSGPEIEVTARPSHRKHRAKPPVVVVPDNTKEVPPIPPDAGSDGDPGKSDQTASGQ